MTSASVFLHENGEGANYDLEIRAVDQFDAPSTVLAGTSIANVPATVAPGPRKFTGTFAAPATVVVGLRYALVITGQPDQSSLFKMGFTNPCPDGTLFFAATTTGAFTSDPTYDLHFETVVTA